MQFDNFRVKDHPKLSEVVYATIKKRLISQSEWIASGVKLQENQLARELGVSRTPVREAMHKLEKDGLIQIIPRRGAFVRTVSSKDVREIFDIRGALESLVVRTSLSFFDKKRLFEMRTRFKECEELVQKGDLSSFIQLDEEFHDFLIRSGKNERSIQMIENLNNQIRLARFKSFSVPGRAKKAFDEHKRIIDVMLAGDKAKAEKLILEHSENAKQNILSFVQE